MIKLGRLAYLSAVTVLVATLAGAPLAAENEGPDALLKELTSEVLRMVIDHKDIQVGTGTKLTKLIEVKIEPHFDIVRMTQIAMAGNWQRATAEQQKTLTTEFRTLLIHTYSTVLGNYRNQPIEFKPLKAASTDIEVTVKSVMKVGADSMTIDYQMAKSAAGWKIYEITLDGINLIANYRATFAAKIRDGGVDNLIKALRDKNRQNAIA